MGILENGPYTLEMDDRPALALARDGEVLLRFESDAFELGVVGALSDTANYDPYRVYVPHSLYRPLEDLKWLRPIEAEFVASDGLALALTYDEGQSARLEARISGDGRFELTWLPQGGRTAMLRLGPRAAADEGFYGLGEYFDDVNHRGKVRAMQIEVDPTLESLYNEAHVPVPLLIGTRGWGMFVESFHPGAFAVAHADDTRIEAAFGTSGELRFHLLAAQHPLDVTERYYQITGFPRLPARWALGPWVWRDESAGQTEVEADVDSMRDLDLAATGYWIDRPYATGVNTFDFESARFPDPTQMIAKLHGLGFRAALWHTPYLDEQDASTAALRDEATSAGYYPSQTGIPLNDWGPPLDFTNAAAVDWWRDQLSAYIALGIEGFKLDYGEDVIVGPFDDRTPWSFSDGSDERTMKNGYPLAYHATYASLLPESGGFLLCRAGAFGDQQHGPIIWPGDLDANMARHGETVDDYVAVGGLPASVVAGLSLGPSGFPFFGADTGGYRHSPPDKETFMRWFEQTALSTVMQIGTSSNDVAWEPTPENGFDAEVLDSYRVYTRLHLRLFPYLWSYATALLRDGRPIQRALGLAHPELGVHPNDIYLLGDALLVAPIVERGATSRTVTFPEGEWVHWFTGESVSGPGDRVIDAPLGRLPLFLRAGALVPMLRPTIDTLSPTTEPTRVDSYATDPGVLYVRAVAGHAASFSLFDGGSLAVEDGVLRFAPGADLDRGVMFELLGAAIPSAVEQDGVPLPEHASLAELEAATEGWFHDGNALWIKFTEGEVSF